MKNFLLVSLLFLIAVGCSSSRHKAENIETKIENHGEVSGDTKVGVKDGEMMVQKKVLMNEELRRLQYEVYELEDRVYGNRRYGTSGLYGVLKDCRLAATDPKNGGDGKLRWTEPMDRVTDKEDEFKMGLDEEKKLVGVSEEFLKDRIDRFKGYKQVLQKRQDEYEDKLSICKAELRTQKAKVAKESTSE